MGRESTTFQEKVYSTEHKEENSTAVNGPFPSLQKKMERDERQTDRPNCNSFSSWYWMQYWLKKKKTV